MTEALNSKALESDIREQLLRSSKHEEVAERLLQKYQSVDLNQASMESLAIFFLNSGNASTLRNFCLTRLEKDLRIPWGHFAASLYRCAGADVDNLSSELRKALLEGAEANARVAELAQYKSLDSIFPEFETVRNDRKLRQQEIYKSRKQELLSQVEMLRSQEMEAEEEEALALLLRMFPRDPDLARQFTELRERKAIRLLESKLQSNETPWDTAEQPLLEPAEKEALQIIAKSMHEKWQELAQDEEIGHDFAMALMMWDDFEASLDFLPENNHSSRITWTRLEAQLHARHFLNLLSGIDKVERSNAANPEATFALLYMKAISLWGLGHRFAAVEIMEGIVAHRPHYRSAMTLLHLWKDGGR